MLFSSSEKDLKARCILTTSPLYETFYSISLLFEENVGIHRSWTEHARTTLGARFYEIFDAIGGDPFLWRVLPDVVGIAPVDVRLADIRALVEDVSGRDFEWRILEGIFHGEAVVNRLCARAISLEQAVVEVPAVKREWLAYLGLFPYDARARTARMIQALLDDPQSFQGSVSGLVSTFLEEVFADTWSRMVPNLLRSTDEKKRLFAACSLQEFLTRSLLRVEANAEEGSIRAIRGGYTAPYDRIERLYFLPSAFNVQRLWSAFSRPDGNVVAYLPYFEPSISLDEGQGGQPLAQAEPEADPALMFKALGDPTRYAMAKLIAAAELSSAELARRLGITRATVTHHVYLLREAGLITERSHRGATLLRLRREAIAGLSQAALASLFGAKDADS